MTDPVRDAELLARMDYAREAVKLLDEAPVVDLDGLRGDVKTAMLAMNALNGIILESFAPICRDNPDLAIRLASVGLQVNTALRGLERRVQIPVSKEQPKASDPRGDAT